MSKVNQHLTPNTIIKAIRESFGGAQLLYKHGSCIQFYLILKKIFPQASPYWSDIDRHCITKIGGRFYDINGRVIKEKHFKPITAVGRLSWAQIIKADIMERPLDGLLILHNKSIPQLKKRLTKYDCSNKRI